MFRLAEDLICPIVQKTVSKELKSALHYCYSGYDGSINAESVADALEGLALGEKEDPIWFQILAIKLREMIHELEDPDYQYTFDEIGEYLVHQAICAAKDLDDEKEDPNTGEGWITSATPEEIKEVYKEAAAFMLEVAEESLENTEAEIEPQGALHKGNAYYQFASEKIDDFVRRAIFAPCLYKEYEEDVFLPFIVWDLDFTFIEDWGPDEWNRFAHENKGLIDFTENAKGADPISGSLKQAIGDTL